ncbi:cation diffusion facilitator family transporter [Tunicatimonas pelagia]|uniref:cation diffusion facilitator family transporter n=1 Tax=Tunicatimonas pelagia TaxID=931531 RepID=UPI0026651527|nr:cation diffusion facilitator family transporter [Tunicatimonas pelagia]WKN41751.1 cation diffusion facilitator family transporter [Tunicatimonas pelagia]
MAEEHSHDCKHDHDHHHHGGTHVHPVTSNLKVAFFLNLLFTIIEFIGGALTNSVAILADAVHDLGDTFAIGSALFLENYSEKGRSNTFSFGYKRFSPLSALINSIILLVGSIIIAYESIPRLLNPEPVASEGMLYLAILGILMNGAAVLRLKKGGNSINQRTVMLHLMEDALGWVAVLIGSGVMLLTNWVIIDPILSIGIALFILWNAFKNLRKVLMIFLQATPENLDIENIRLTLRAIEGITDVHDIHLWTMDGQYHILSVHVVVEEDKRLNELADLRGRVQQQLSSYHINHITIQFEVVGEKCVLETH